MGSKEALLACRAAGVGVYRRSVGLHDRCLIHG